MQEIDRRISETVESLFRDLNEEIGTRVRSVSDDVVRWIEEKGAEVPKSWLDEISELVERERERVAHVVAPRPAAAAPSFDRILSGLARIDGEDEQPAVLRALVEETEPFASRAAFFLIRQGEVRGWAARGLDDDRVESIRASVDDAPFDDLAGAGSAIVLDEEQAAGLAEHFGVEPAVAAALVPFSIRGQLAGALYADRVDGEALGAAALQILTHGAAMTLETLAVSPGTSPALRLRGELPEPQPVEPEAEEPSEPAAEDASPEAVSVEDASVEDASDAAEEIEVDFAETPVDLDESVQTTTRAVETREDEVEEIEAEEIEVEEIEVEEDGGWMTTAVPPTAPDDDDRAPEAEAEADADDELFVEEEAPSFELAEEEVAVEDTIEVEGEDELAAPSVVSGGGDPLESVVGPSYEPDPSPETTSFEPPSFRPPPAADDLGDESDLPSEEEIAREAARPEPELEDTNIWELEEEDEDEDDEPTAVGMAAVGAEDEEDEESSPPTVEPAPPVAPSPPSFDAGAVGQETVRLDMSALQSQAAALDGAGPVEPAAPAAPAPPASASELPSPPGAPEPPAPAAPEPVAPSSFVEPPPPVSAPPTSFAPEPAAPEPAAPEPAAPTAPEPIAPAAPELAAPEPAAPEPPAPEPAAPAPEPPTPVASEPAAPTAPAPPSPPRAEAAESDDAKADVGGSTEVKPPADHDGPGLAFAQTAQAPVADDGNEALHEEARRLARLLVSEIKLYNEEIIEEGRRAGNIYDRLKDDIDRSRQMYEERIDPRLADQEDYFYQELVQRLAGGDRNLLGM